jgi:hypothetical protein
MQEAPGMFKYDGNNHCYVCRQPLTDAELTDMIGTAWKAELQCIRYRGCDFEVFRRLAELDLRHICDMQPPAHIGPVVRNHVEFVVRGQPPIRSPDQLAGEFQDYLFSLNNEWRAFVSKPIHCRDDMAAFEFAWYDNHFHPIVFYSIPDRPIAWHVECPLKNEPSDRGVGNIVFDWLKRNESRFTDPRWYTDADWHGSKHWQSTPW